MAARKLPVPAQFDDPRLAGEATFPQWQRSRTNDGVCVGKYD